MTERLAEHGKGVAVETLEPAAVVHADLSGHWQLLNDEPVAGLDGWSYANLGELARLESNYAEAVEGDHVVHLDLRSDNIVFGAAETDDVVVDWPHACRGAHWIDLVAMLPSLHLDGGPEPEEALRASTIGNTAEPSAVDVFLTSIAGYFTRMSLLPPPPGLPTVRQFKRPKATSPAPGCGNDWANTEAETIGVGQVDSQTHACRHGTDERRPDPDRHS